MGLYEGHHIGRPPKLSSQQQKQLCKLADEQGGTANALRCQWSEKPEQVQISSFTLKRYLRRMGFRYKRCRLSLKTKRNQDAFERAQGVIASLQATAKAGKCDLLSFDESGFSPNPPVQYGWTRIRQTRCAESGSHNQRGNVLGARRQDNELIWCAQQKRTVRDDVIAFFDQIAEQTHPVPCIVLLDNARIHKGDVMEEKRRQWERKGFYLYYLPPYSPALNRIEILWKRAKYFWRKFTRLTGDELIDKVHSIMKNYGKKFTINFA